MAVTVSQPDQTRYPQHTCHVGLTISSGMTHFDSEQKLSLIAN